MKRPVTMPRLTDTMEEGTITRWIKRIGDRVLRNEVLFEVETDKMTVEVEAVDDGYLHEIIVCEGASAAVGHTIAYLTDPDDPEEPSPVS